MACRKELRPAFHAVLALGPSGTGFHETKGPVVSFVPSLSRFRVVDHCQLPFHMNAVTWSLLSVRGLDHLTLDERSPARPFLGMDNVNAGSQAMSDEDLFARIAEGDDHAFAQFYDRHSAVLFAVALRILNQTEEAEDALQDALTMLWERAALYNRALGRPLSWAIVLTRNKAIDLRRTRQRGPEILVTSDGDMPDHPDSTAPASNRHEIDDDLYQVRQAVASLPQEQRMAIELAFFGGRTHSEVAAMTNAPLGTVKARIRRGMLTLKDGLEGRL